jgi:hypothetical protein
MDEALKKSLTDLIDETLLELEELKKSRYSAEEIQLKGPGEGIAGKPANGDLKAKKAEDEDEEHDEDEDEEDVEKADEDGDEEDDEDSDDVEKADEDEDEEDDEDEEVEKGDDDSADLSHESSRKLKSIKEGPKSSEVLSELEETPVPSRAKKPSKKDMRKSDKEPHKDDPKHEEKEKKLARKLLDMHKKEVEKSLEESETLLKSAIEERVRPLEDKISTIYDLVRQIAEQPVPSKGTSARAVPLMKSAEDFNGEVLTKSEVASRLFQLKKSGTNVDSADIARAEMGHDLNKIVEKYNIS